MATSQQKHQDDKFGTKRYDALKAELKQHKVSKELQARFDKAATVFEHRRGIHHELHNAELESSWGSHRTIYNLKERLAAFKPVEYFLDVMAAIIEEVKKEEAGALAAKMAKKKPTTGRGWGNY